MHVSKLVLWFLVSSGLSVAATSEESRASARARALAGAARSPAAAALSAACVSAVHRYWRASRAAWAGQESMTSAGVRGGGGGAAEEEEEEEGGEEEDGAADAAAAAAAVVAVAVAPPSAAAAAAAAACAMARTAALRLALTVDFIPSTSLASHASTMPVASTALSSLTRSPCAETISTIRFERARVGPAAREEGEEEGEEEGREEEEGAPAVESAAFPPPPIAPPTPLLPSNASDASESNSPDWKCCATALGSEP